MKQRDHWETVHASQSARAVGWYQPHNHTALDWIEELGLANDAAIIDVGGGASSLVDDLLHRDFRSLSILDYSSNALAAVKDRLGNEAEGVEWLNHDITTIELQPGVYDVWHDRAVFHFLVQKTDRQRYLDNLRSALKSGGRLIMGVFAKEAPAKCSGLPVERYGLEQLTNTLGQEFELERHAKELHVTPDGVEQMYLYVQFRRIA